MIFSLKKAALTASLALILVGHNKAGAVEMFDGMPLLMSIKTTVYEKQGPDNSFTIYLGATEDNTEFFVSSPKTREYIDVDRFTIGKDNDGSNAVIATAVPLSVDATDNVVKIFGDPKTLDYIDVHGCYISQLDLNPELTNLCVIDASHNELTAIDLSPFGGLQSIDILDNAFTDPSKMVIGSNHPYLEILSVGINEVIDPNLDLSNYPYLAYFSARNNYGLRSIDTSKCPELVSLVLEVTNISSLDVSKNVKLDVLNISNTPINSIDISKNVNLGEFYASHEGSYNVDDKYKFTSIDLSANPKLQYLDLSGNKLTQIDVGNNKNLKLLYLQKNLLSEIDLTNNTALATVNLSNNNFTFATLPLPQDGWDYYYYRQPLPCYFKYRVGEEIDFSKDVIRAPYTDTNGNTITPNTYANVWAEPRSGDRYSVDETAYGYADGKLTFYQVIPDSVYVEFYCDAFEDWPMQSSTFKIKTYMDYDAPSQIFSFKANPVMQGKTVSLNVGGQPVGSGLKLPADITVKAGDETFIFEKAVTSADLSSEPNVTFTLPSNASTVNVFISDGFALTNLSIDGVSMKSIDLSPSENIINLSVTNSDITTIDLGYNGALRSLNLSGNNLTEIDLSPVRGDYEKWYLTDVNLSNNNLSAITATSPKYIETLNLSHNNFSEFDFKYYTGLKKLCLSDNHLSRDLDLSTVEALESLDLTSNSIENVTLANPGKIKELLVANNNFSFATLPILSSDANYVYSPQAKYSIVKGGAAVNLSNQNVNGATNYTWKYADTETIVDPLLLDIKDGSTWFDSSLIGKTVFCEMTNPAFPDFDASPLTTTEFNVQDRPTNLVATYTTAEEGEGEIGFRFMSDGAHSIYIDTYGDGSQLEEIIYDLMNTDIYRKITTHAGATAKVYSFESPENVTCFYTRGFKMNNLDLTLLTNLQAVNVHTAMLTDGNLLLPKSSALYEIILDGNAFETQTFEGYPRLSNLNLGDNRYKSFDASLYPNAMFVTLSGNQIETIKFAKGSALYQLLATGNRLKDIDLSGLDNLQELILIDNELSSIDISKVPNLRILQIEGNRFTFSTLPETATKLNWFTYANQQPVQVTCVNGVVDLSDENVVNGNKTQYRCFLGDRQSDVYFDYNDELFVSDGELYSNEMDEENPEFTVDNGVLYFHYMQNKKVIAAMTNDAYPNLLLFTAPFEIDAAAGITDVSVDNFTGLVNVYTVTGVLVRSQLPIPDATKGLSPGIYIVSNGKTSEKILVK